MEIPKEKGISEIPNSIGQIQNTDNKIFSIPNFEMTSQHTISSMSALSSYYAGQSRESNVLGLGLIFSLIFLDKFIL